MEHRLIVANRSKTYPLSSPNFVKEATNSSRPGGSSSSGLDMAASEISGPILSISRALTAVHLMFRQDD